LVSVAIPAVLGRMTTEIFVCSFVPHDLPPYSLGRNKTARRLTKRGGEKWQMSVQLKPGESQDDLLRRFRKQVANSGILGELRKRRWFVSKGEKRRMERKRAIRKARQRRNRRK
jgi:small subunit ribosomal protein S21